MEPSILVVYPTNCLTLALTYNMLDDSGDSSRTRGVIFTITIVKMSSNHRQGIAATQTCARSISKKSDSTRSVNYFHKRPKLSIWTKRIEPYDSWRPGKGILPKFGGEQSHSTCLSSTNSIRYIGPDNVRKPRKRMIYRRPFTVTFRELIRN